MFSLGQNIEAFRIITAKLLIAVFLLYPYGKFNLDR